MPQLSSKLKALIRTSLHRRAIAFHAPRRAGAELALSEAEGSPAQLRWRPRPGNPAPLRLAPPTTSWRESTILLQPPTRDGEYYLRLTLRDPAGRSDSATTYFVVENQQPRLPDSQTENPAWVEHAIIYGVVPRNFGPHGFQSVIQRLDYLTDLGINTIWLSPCNATPTTSHGHGYGITDYFRLRPDCGTKADFRALVKAAHSRGIRLLMDFVPNHTSIQHPYLKDAQARGKASPYYDFYDRTEDGQPTHYFHWRSLPNLNYDHPKVRRMMLDAFSYWLRRFDVDGFRVDSAWGIKLRRPDFWPQWRRELKRIKPDLLLLAEATARDPYWFTHGFDAAYDWTDDLGHWSMEHVFQATDGLVPRLHQALTNQGRGFHPDALIFRFLNNNDTGPRFITRYGRAMEKVAAAMLLTLPGLPCLYTGQEVGAEFEPYRTPGPISWQDRRGLRHYYRKLIWLRRELPALHSRRWEILALHGSKQAYAYARYGPPGAASALVLLNFSPHKTAPTLSLPEHLRAFASARQLTDLLADERLPVPPSSPRTLQLPLLPWSARILVPPS